MYIDHRFWSECDKQVQSYFMENNFDALTVKCYLHSSIFHDGQFSPLIVNDQLQGLDKSFVKFNIKHEMHWILKENGRTQKRIGQEESDEGKSCWLGPWPCRRDLKV